MDDNKKDSLNINENMQIEEDYSNDNKENKASNRKKYKKKTLKRITLDPPDEIDYGDDYDQSIHDPEDTSKNLIYENRNNIISRSIIYSPSKKIITDKNNISFSNKDIKKIEEKIEQKNLIEELKTNELKNEENDEIIDIGKDLLEDNNSLKISKNEENKDKIDKKNESDELIDINLDEDKE